MMSTKTKILIVDDEAGIRGLIQGILEDEGFEAFQAADSVETFDLVRQRRPDLIILDIWLEGSPQDGLEILAAVKKEYAHIPVIMISGHGNVETAVSAIKKGAYDFIEKPFKSDRLLLMIRRALEASALRRENENLKNQNLIKSESVDFVPAERIFKEVTVFSLDGQDLSDLPLKESREIFERKYLQIQIDKFDGNISRTAAFIGMERSALHRKIKSLGLGESKSAGENHTGAEAQRVSA